MFDLMRPVFALGAGLAEDPAMILTAGLWRLVAEWDGVEVTVAWSAIADDADGAYRVWRAESEEGTYAIVDDGPIAAGQGDYDFADDLAALDDPLPTYWYKVTFSGPNGDETFGPVEVTAAVADDDTADDDTGDDDTTDDDTSDDDTSDDDTGDDDTASDDDTGDDDSADDDTGDDDDSAADDDSATDDDATDDDDSTAPLPPIDGDDDDDDDGGCGC
ncbi:MAG: hypothetical protein M5R36_05660 [Deltaproteobacteria bacterium]|nr:hypothetical protein [Deltaproteobacteria bacterium]